MKKRVFYIQNNQLEAFKNSLADLTSLNGKDHSGRTLLHYAALYLNIDFIKALLELDLEVDCLDKNKNTTLGHLVIFANAFPVESGETKNKIIKLLLENGADPNYKKSKSGYSLLHDAVMNKDLDVIQALLRYGANVNEAENPYHYTPAFFTSDLECLKLLQRSGADFDKRDSKGNTILASLILLLPEKLALQTLQYFLQFSTCIAGDFSSVLKTTIVKNRVEIAGFLIREFGKEPFFELNFYLIQTVKRNSLPITKMFLLQMSDPNEIIEKETNRSPLHYAVINNEFEMVELLLESGFRSAKDINGKEPIDYSKRNKIRTLLKEIVMSEQTKN